MERPRVRRLLWFFAAVAILAAAGISWMIRSRMPEVELRRPESNPFWVAFDREFLEYLRLRDEYDKNLKELEAAGQPNAWKLAEPARARMEEQQKKFGDAHDMALKASRK